MMTSGMYASRTCEWETPQALFDRLDAAYHFECDVCATAENAKCAKYYDQETDGLKQTWTGVCWMNPPYGREIGKWMHKALDSARAGAGGAGGRAEHVGLDCGLLGGADREKRGGFCGRDAGCGLGFTTAMIPDSRIWL